ncbi:hypothetical protein PAHAL_9G488800 [Panicum hallii]|uniref:Uncharacterized protein n=1 Tax=Panicum hallii TaxID=206008 RepID=A0A2T8I544_9POAL|nr:hypothetical protein PAHAL_9G488800 [Panicum hallii]
MDDILYRAPDRAAESAANMGCPPAGAGARARFSSSAASRHVFLVASTRKRKACLPILPAGRPGCARAAQGLASPSPCPSRGDTCLSPGRDTGSTARRGRRKHSGARDARTQRRVSPAHPPRLGLVLRSDPAD